MGHEHSPLPFMSKLLLILMIGWTTVAQAQEAKQPIELTSKKTYNQDVFDLGSGKKNYKIHVAQINYKDTDGSFKKIDTKLSQNMATDKWEQSKASYHCKIPRYADGEFEFFNAYEGSNQTLKAIPQAQHVEGVSFKGDDGQGVIYKDAFGKGIDLKVYAYWAGLKKVIIINEKPADTKTDLTFDFELILPTREETKDLSTKTVVAHIIDAKTATEWSKASMLDFTSKTLKIGFDDKCSYFRDARVWDSGELNQSVDISLYVKDNKTYIRKTIKAEILEKAVYPLMTDHPTSYYAGAGDGRVDVLGSSGGSWSDAHDAVTGTAAYPLLTQAYAWVRKTSTQYGIQRVFLPIDTSGIDDGATIESASIYLYVLGTSDGDNDGDDWVNIVGQTSQGDNTTLTTADFDTCGSVTNPTEGSTRKDISSDITSSAYNNFSLNSTGKEWISKTGYSLFGFREGHDCLNSAIGNLTLNYVQISTSEDTSGTKDPYLDVTTSAGGGTTTSNPMSAIGNGIGRGIGVGCR